MLSSSKSKTKKGPKKTVCDALAQHPDIVNRMILEFIDGTALHPELSSTTQSRKAATDFVDKQLKELVGPDISVKDIGGANNLNLLVTYKGEEFVIQIGTARESTIHALQKLTGSSQDAFLADRYSTFVFNDVESSKELTLLSGVSSSPPPVGLLIVVEKLDSSLEKETQKNKEKEKKVMVGTSKAIAFAANAGQQLASTFDVLAKNHLVCTDFKPENELARENQDGSPQFVIADFKALMPSDGVPTFNTGKKKGQLNLNSLVTGAYLSEQGDHALFAIGKPPDKPEEIPSKIEAVMEKEYSYQLAIMLHYCVTGEVVLKKGVPARYDINLDKEIFNTHDGQKLKDIILMLSKPNLSERLHYRDAQRLLAVIGDDKEYKAALKEMGITPPSQQVALTATSSAATSTTSSATPTVTSTTRAAKVFAGSHEAKEALKTLQRKGSMRQFEEKGKEETAETTIKKTQSTARPAESPPLSPIPASRKFNK